MGTEPWFDCVEHPERGSVEEPISEQAVIDTLMAAGLASSEKEAKVLMDEALLWQTGITIPATATTFERILMPPDEEPFGQ